MGSKFVRPEVATLHLSDGDTLTVRRRLTAGEQHEMFARMYVAGADGRYHVNPLETGRAIILAYLIDWSLTDEDGTLVAIRDQPIDVVIGAVNTLEPKYFTEIKEAIEAHEARMIGERVKEKNGPDGGRKSPATSPSPDGAAGGMNGSATSTRTSTTSSLTN